jgi:type I restriction enzyme S subunit
MSCVSELINMLCPNGVSFERLGASHTFNRGRWIKAGLLKSGNFPVVTSSQRVTEYHNEFNRDGETVVVSSSGAYAGYVSFWDGPIYLSNAFSVDIVNTLLLPKFTYYVLKNMQQRLHDLANGAGVPNIYGKDIENIPIPVPPIEIQREIVRVLDTFSKLEAELEAELEARRHQYTFYRDLLLTCADQGVQWQAVGEVCDISRGKVISKDYLRDNPGPYPVYSSQTQDSGVFGYIDSYAYDFESVTWTTDGAHAGSVFYHNDKKFSITNVCGLLRIKRSDELSAKYLYYQLGKRARAYVNEGMGNPKIMSHTMAKVSIPIPPLAEQERVVSILDKFDALVNDLSIGLPAELDARRKQYEHYRDRLLTFKEATA